jgi:hypothetical protein
MGILGDKIVVAAPAFKNNMRHGLKDTKATESHHPALIRNVAGLYLKIRPADGTGCQWVPSL